MNNLTDGRRALKLTGDDDGPIAAAAFGAHFLGCTTTPLPQNPLYEVKFRTTFNSSDRDLSEYICNIHLHRKMS